MDHQEYEQLLSEIRKREEEAVLLNQEISNLNERYTETRDHLERAEEYIIQLQERYDSESPVNALATKPDT